MSGSTWTNVAPTISITASGAGNFDPDGDAVSVVAGISAIDPGHTKQYIENSSIGSAGNIQVTIAAGSGIEAGKYKIAAYLQDTYAGNAKPSIITQSNMEYWYDNTAPNISSITVDGGANQYTKKLSYNIAVNATDNMSGIARYTWVITNDSGSTIYTGSNTNSTFLIDNLPQTTSNTNYTLVVTAVDKAGNIKSLSTDLKYDGYAPQISSVV